MEHERRRLPVFSETRLRDSASTPIDQESSQRLGSIEWDGNISQKIASPGPKGIAFIGQGLVRLLLSSWFVCEPGSIPKLTKLNPSVELPQRRSLHSLLNMMYVEWGAEGSKIKRPVHIRFRECTSYYVDDCSRLVIMWISIRLQRALGLETTSTCNGSIDVAS